VSSVFPRDAQLHLPAQRSAHRLHQRVAAKAATLSWANVADDIATATGVRMGTRHIEEVVSAAAQDCEAFSGHPCPEEGQRHAAATPMQVLTCDGKGVVRRPRGAAGGNPEAGRGQGPPRAPRLCAAGDVASHTDGNGGGP
jgi:hypothetical protein